MSSDEEEVTSPVFDRSTKPAKMAPSSDMHHRDFLPVWGDVVSIVYMYTNSPLIKGNPVNNTNFKQAMRV